MSILLLLIPIMKSFEWKYRWFIPAFVIAVVECVAVVFLNNKKNELVDDTLIGYIYSVLSIEIRLTASAWALLITNLIILGCMIKIMYDIRRNFITYQLPLMQM